jgi:hypothetical protein
MSNPITVSDEAVEAALTVWSAAAWDNIRMAFENGSGTLPDPAAAMRAALEAAAPFMREASSDQRLNNLVKRAKATFDALSPEEQAAKRQAQQESWVRGEIGIGDDAQEAQEREAFRALDDNPLQAQPAPSVGEAQFPRVWAVVEEYRRRHEGPRDPYLPTCEVCEMLRALDRALSASTPSPSNRED